MRGAVEGTRDIVVNKADQFPVLIEFITQAFISSASTLSYCDSLSCISLL